MMCSETKEAFIVFGVITAGVISVMLFIFITMAAILYHVTYDYQVEVKNGDTVIYVGPSACVSYTTAGNKTIVRIMKPFLFCSIAQEREIVSDKITVNTLSKEYKL